MHRKVEEKEAVGMSYCGVCMGGVGWVRGRLTERTKGGGMGEVGRPV